MFAIILKLKKTLNFMPNGGVMPIIALKQSAKLPILLSITYGMM